MASKTDKEMDLHCLPSLDGCTSILVSGVSGEVQPLPRSMQIFYDSEDSAYLVNINDQESEVSVFASRLLSNGVFVDDSGQAYVELVGDGGETSTIWLKQLKTQVQWKTVKLARCGKCAVKNYVVPRKGAKCFFTVRDIQEMINMADYTKEYKDEWIGRSWQRWEEFADSIHVPRDHLERSGKSIRARAQRAGGGQASSKDGEFMVSSVMLISLLCRWSVFLGKKARQSVPIILKALVQKAVEPEVVHIFLSSGSKPLGMDSWPTAVPDSDLKIIMQNGYVDVQPMKQFIPDLQSALKRW